MSSMNTTTNLSNSSIKTEFMRYMKCAGAFINPNDMTRYSKRSYVVLKVVCCIEGRLGYIFATNLDLMISGAEINFREHLGSR
jgi:hypothetical protein